jgi:prevent-host-death family protein
MTLQNDALKTEVGVRELHDHLSRYVHEVQNGTEITVTMRGRRVARLVPIEDDDPLADLRARGLIREPSSTHRRTAPKRVSAAAPVSDLVAEQRR